MEKKKRILILIESYLPGFKNGGHGRSISNLVDFYSDQYDFYIYTSDRDFGDKVPYPNINRNEWDKVNGAFVMYNKPFKLWLSVSNIIKKNDIDIVFTCGFFSNYTLRILLSKWFRNISIPIIIAPMGQFGPNALKFKAIIKNWIISIINYSKILKYIDFSVTSVLEDNNVKSKLKNISSFIIEDLPTKYEHSNELSKLKISGYLNAVFISRIHPSKNLLEAIKVLKIINGEITFDIYGVIEDKAYWKLCTEEIAKLPSNIHVKYFGEVHPTLVPKTFTAYDIFIFPTLGENYGHVIFESISGGCIPIISDKTPWNDIESYKCGNIYPLGNTDKASEIVQKYTDMNFEEISKIQKNAINYYQKRFHEKTSNHNFSKMINEILK